MIEFSINNSGKVKLNTLHYFIIGISFILIIYFYPTFQSILVLAVIFGYGLYLTSREKKKSVGKIYLTDQKIKIITDASEFQSDLAHLNRLEIIYSGYKGKRITGDFIPRYNVFSGTDNYIKISKDNVTIEYKFEVDSKIQENDLLEMVRQWKELGYNTSNIRLNI